MDIKDISGGLIVSCQASKQEPLHGANIMAAMAKAAEEGGAKGIRAEGSKNIKAIQKAVSLPVIGIEKNHEYNSEVFITPTIKEVKNIYEAGANIIALDSTIQTRPRNVKLIEIINYIKEKINLPIMADVSTLEEAKIANELGVDLIATTLVGYTNYTQNFKPPDFNLLEEMVNKVNTPVILEGGVRSPEEAQKALEMGAYAVVVGTAITRPQIVTSWFVEAMQKTKEISD